ncbi:hypothetical protein Tco_1158226 [Tanacetum coccineum]
MRASNLLVAAGCLAHCDYLSSSQCLSKNEGDPRGCKSKKKKSRSRRIKISYVRSFRAPIRGKKLEEADRLRKENKELKKAVKSQQLEWQKFVNHFNAHQTDGYHPTFEHGSTSQIVHGDDLDGDDLDVDGTCDGDGSGSLDGDSDDDSNDGCDEEY